jgi:hypothetical protein
MTSEPIARGVAYIQISKLPGLLTDHCGTIPQPWARIDGPAAMTNDENSKQVMVMILALAILALVFWIVLFWGSY